MRSILLDHLLEVIFLMFCPDFGFVSSIVEPSRTLSDKKGALVDVTKGCAASGVASP